MNKLKIETLTQKLHNADTSGSIEVYNKALKEFANWAYVMALRGRLYCTTESGEMRKVEVKEYKMEDKFKIGDKVYVEDWFYGTIVDIDGNEARCKSDTCGGGGTLTFPLEVLRLEK